MASTGGPLNRDVPVGRSGCAQPSSSPRCITAILMFLNLPAGYHDVTPGGMPPEYIASEKPQQMMETLTDGIFLMTIRTSICQDSMRG